MRYKTDEEAKQIAQDLIANRIFMSDQIRDPSEIGLVFMVIMLADKETTDKWVADEVVHAYEYIDKASPRSINGYPTFFSASLLTREDYTAVIGYEKKLRDAMAGALNEPA